MVQVSRRRPLCGQTSDSTTGESTTGTPTTTDPTTGGSGEDVYLCSLRTHEKCADLIPDDALGALEPDWYDGAHGNLPNNSSWDACWVKVNQNFGNPGQKHFARCAHAADESAARLKCEANCQMRNTFLDDLCVGPGCTYNAINCNLNPLEDPDDTPKLLSENTSTWECEPGGMIIPVWGGDTDLVLFDADGTMVLGDGTTASLLNVVGYLGFETTNCTATTCDLVIDALEGLSTNSAGYFMDAAGTSAPYSLKGFGFRASSVVTGQWDKIRGTVSFPTTTLAARFWADLLVYDGVELWPGTQTIEIDQIVGSLTDEDGPLTLNLAYNSALGTANVSLTTR